MGIVNASPESFSDGASVGGLDEQVERARWRWAPTSSTWAASPA